MEKYIKYILKSDLVAKIDNILDYVDECWDTDYAIGAKRFADRLQDAIDTLEVKEMDLEKEINKYICDNFFGSETMGFFANRTKEEPNDQDIALCARHFFELGLKCRKENRL